MLGNIIGMLLVAPGVVGHGMMNMPMPRNNAGSVPITPETDPSNLGDAMYWFQQGCYIGCPECDPDLGTSLPFFNTPPASCEGHLLSPTLPLEARTMNIMNGSAYGDWTMHHPWRAPGSAPVIHPCGADGGTKGTAGGQETWAPFAISPGLASAQWTAGGSAEVAWSIWANHGGGYQYRLCPADEELSEACFQRTPLAWATDTTRIHATDGTRPDVEIPAVEVSAGTLPKGGTWRRNPFPTCNCDFFNEIYSSLGDFGNGCSPSAAYPAYDGYCGMGGTPGAVEQQCATGLQFEPPTFTGCGYHPGNQQIVDRVSVPTAPGAYVLQWRWDCEHSSQVWENCADIIITEAPVAIV